MDSDGCDVHEAMICDLTTDVRRFTELHSAPSDSDQRHVSPRSAYRLRMSALIDGFREAGLLPGPSLDGCPHGLCERCCPDHESDCPDA